jgi:hypothetical protein
MAAKFGAGQTTPVIWFPEGGFYFGLRGVDAKTSQSTGV